NDCVLHTPPFRHKKTTPGSGVVVLPCCCTPYAGITRIRFKGRRERRRSGRSASSQPGPPGLPCDLLSHIEYSMRAGGFQPGCGVRRRRFLSDLTPRLLCDMPSSVSRRGAGLARRSRSEGGVRARQPCYPRPHLRYTQQQAGRALRDSSAAWVRSSVRVKSRNEISAGGVVSREGPDGVEVIVGKDAGYQKWVLPKGLVRKNEEYADAALREVEEETGVRPRLVAPI